MILKSPSPLCLASWLASIWVRRASVGERYYVLLLSIDGVGWFRCIGLLFWLVGYETLTVCGDWLFPTGDGAGWWVDMVVVEFTSYIWNYSGVIMEGSDVLEVYMTSLDDTSKLSLEYFDCFGGAVVVTVLIDA